MNIYFFDMQGSALRQVTMEGSEAEAYALAERHMAVMPEAAHFVVTQIEVDLRDICWRNGQMRPLLDHPAQWLPESKTLINMPVPSTLVIDSSSYETDEPTVVIDLPAGDYTLTVRSPCFRPIKFEVSV